MKSDDPNRERHSHQRGGVPLLLAATIICLGLAEIAIRGLFSETAFLDARTDEFWLTLLDSRLRSGQWPTDIEHDPRLGWRMKPKWSDGGIRHNSFGYRSDVEFAEQSEHPRIVAIGDSFTYGLGVANEATYASVLASMTGVEVINAGVNGYGIDQAVLLWEHEASIFDPDVVVLGYFVDDFNRNVLTLRDGGAKPYFARDESSAFRVHGVPVPPLEELRANGALEPSGQLRIWQALAHVKRLVMRKLGHHLMGPTDERVAISEHVLQRLSRSVARSGARLLVVIIDHCFDGTDESLWIEREILASCRNLDIDCLNVADAMRGPSYESFYLDNCHWSESGHRFAAERIAEALVPLREGAASVADSSL